MLRMTRRRLSRVVILGLTLVFSTFVQPARAADERCFPETNQCIGGRFRQYWEQNGGLLAHPG